ncbi:hypothetical protein [Roseateles sp. DB2]|uniref:hypothetical protein n=1 Tax=Roseateles sp. DB2 TaxID=3453717 RepID=UPI003F6F5343
MFLALALAAMLLGLWQDPPERQGRPVLAGPGPGPRLLEDSDHPVPPTAPARAPADTSETTAGVRTVRIANLAPPPHASHPWPLPPGSLPATAAGDAPPGLGSAATGTSDWRDGALDLLSQIGLLCPAAGCDSLEDD